MQVFCLNTLEELARYADDWDRLAAGVPFRTWTWLSTWWRHYGEEPEKPQRRRLCVPCVFDASESLVGVAPWYLECSAARGRVLRMLGSGEVCSDYLSILCQPGREEPATDALADWLMDQAIGRHDDAVPWDLLELSGVDAEDPGIGRLTGHLGQRGMTVHRRPGPNCWRLELPTSWDQYLMMLSKKRRQHARRLEKDYLTTGRAKPRMAEQLDELPAALDLLIGLHQRRHVLLGEPGCYESERFTAFSREVLPALLCQGQLRFYTLELDGKPVAAEYLLVGNGVLYAYQAGIDPDALEHEPGSLIYLAMLKQAIEQGYRGFDFLRGDEPYKAYYRAAPRQSLEWRIVPPRSAAQWRHSLWLAGSNLKHWLRSGLERVGAKRE